MTDKDFTMVMLDELEITLWGDGSLYVNDSHSSFHQTFEPGERFYKEILIEWKERNDLYERRLWGKYHLLFRTALKMSAFFDINMADKRCIGEENGSFMQLTYEEYDCFKDLLAEAIDRGLGLMFNKLSE